MSASPESSVISKPAATIQRPHGISGYLRVPAHTSREASSPSYRKNARSGGNAMRKSGRRASGLVLAVLFATVLPLFESTPQTVACLVTTTNGDVQGVANVSSCTFLGIPFAAPPVGNLRWRPPQPAAPWAPATLNATTLRQCPQIFPAGTTTTLGNEDCLRLNIWTPNPAPTAPAPVIFWIHTGAFQGASANFADSNGQESRGANGCHRGRG